MTHNNLDYLTFWVITLTFIVLGLSLFIKLPVFLVSTVLSFITATSLTASFFVIIPNIELLSNEVVKKDFIIHIIPLVIAIFLMNFSLINVNKTKNFNYDFIKAFCLFIFVLFIYFISKQSFLIYENSMVKYIESDYSYDTNEQKQITKKHLIILSVFIILIFCSSFPIYYNFLNGSKN